MPGSQQVAHTTPEVATATQAIAAWSAAAYAAGSLALIPYGRVPAGWFVAVLSGLAVVALVAARCDRARRWDTVTLWPLLAWLTVMALSIAQSPWHELALPRARTAPLFGLMFIAVQLACWRPRALRMVIWAGMLAMLVMVADVMMARWFGQTLITQAAVHESVRASASQGNPNDFAAVSVLIPLGMLLFAGRWVLLCHACASAAGSFAWILTAGRQVLLGWLVATLAPLAPRFRLRSYLFACAAVVVVVVATLLLHAGLRARLQETVASGLGIREQLIAVGMAAWWKRPWLGNGPFVFAELYRQYAESGWVWRGQALRNIGMPWVHCLPVEILCELGVLGATVMTGVMVVAIQRVRRGLAFGGMQREHAVVAASMLATIAVMGLVDLTFLKDWVKCLFWLAIGLAWVSGAQGDATQEQARHRPKA